MSMAGSGRLALLADQDGAARVRMANALRGNGFRVIESRTPSEAVGHIHARPDIDLLVITARINPEEPDLDLVHWVAQKHPEVRMLIVCGYCEKIRSSKPGHYLFLQKPVPATVLVQRAKTILAMG